MINIKKNLDSRICDIEDGANTETYREFINNSLTEFYGEAKYDLDNMSNKELNELLNFLDELWEK